MYQMLTGMFVFSIDRGTKRSEAMKALYNKLTVGTWSWPNDIQISLQCFKFLNDTMQHDPVKRPNWIQMQEHEFFRNDEPDMIKFDIVFDQDPPEGVLFKDNKIFVNTKDPTLYQKFHQAAINKFVQETGEQLEEQMNNVLAGS